MSNEQYELVQRYLGSREYLTIKIYDCYLLFHRNIIPHSHNHELGLELPPAIIKKIFGSNPLSVIDVTSSRHVHPSLYDVVVLADKSVLHTRIAHEKNKSQRLPYYVPEDLELLKCRGMSKEDIQLFVQKLDQKERVNVCCFEEYEAILQKIIDLTDIPTRLKCRLVSRKWQMLVDRSSSWNCIRLTKLTRYVDRALTYFQKLDLRQLDLSQSSFDLESSGLKHPFLLFSLRSLCISTDQSLDFCTFLFRLAPFLRDIQLIQPRHSSRKSQNNQFYDYIRLMICLCQKNLKHLRRLHIRLRSVSDQIFLQSSTVGSIPISYELIACRND